MNIFTLNKNCFVVLGVVTEYKYISLYDFVNDSLSSFFNFFFNIKLEKNKFKSKQIHNFIFKIYIIWKFLYSTEFLSTLIELKSIELNLNQSMNLKKK